MGIKRRFNGKSLQAWRFFADLSNASLPTIVENEDSEETKYESKIPIFREGTFDHPWYGDLEFDLEYLNQLVKNHSLKVIPQQISFDKDHEPGDGAYAWVREENGLEVQLIQVGDRAVNALFANIEYTPEGYEEVIVKKKFKYFSSEINDNYTNHEMIVGPNGEKQISYHGPTLIGGGFTNRPFIPNLGTVFSTDAQGDEQEQDLVMIKSQKDEDSAIFGTIVGLGCDLSKHVSQPVSAGEKQGENEMKFSELLKLAKAFSGNERRAYLLSQLPQLEDTDEQDLIKSMVASEESVELSQRIAEEATRNAANAVAKLEAREATILALNTQVMEAKQLSYQNQAIAFSEKLKADNFAPAVADEVKEVLLALNVESRNHKFSLDGSEAPVSLIEILNRIFSKMPEDLRVPTANVFSTQTPEAVEPPEAIEPPEASPKSEDSPEVIELNRRIAIFEKTFSFSPTPDQVKLLNAEGMIEFPNTKEK